jgi:hypothetical protein
MEAFMGQLISPKEAVLGRPILNERDYLDAKKLLAHEINVGHQSDVSERIESLMRAIAEYERRFVDSDGQDSDWVEDAYEAGLQDWDGPTQRWGDSAEI